MSAPLIDTTWMWHPRFEEQTPNTAGCFLHFRKSAFISAAKDIPRCLQIQITADTRYKLYINNKPVSFGPVKGDANLWFYDEIDIAPFLRVGTNYVRVHVLRFFHATNYAPSFPRLPFGGLRIITVDAQSPLSLDIESSTAWEAAIDLDVKLRIDEPEDDFLHIYESHTAPTDSLLQWYNIRLSAYECSTGQSIPWNLSPRLIPPQRVQRAEFCALHNLQSDLKYAIWEGAIIGSSALRTSLPAERSISSSRELYLPADTIHQMDLEVAEHMTAFVSIRFKRPIASGSSVSLLYAESYEDSPTLAPYLRRKGDRQDTTKQLVGPRDIVELRTLQNPRMLRYHDQEDVYETFVPFHFRTFRFIQLRIEVGKSDLQLQDLSIERVNYPLVVTARLHVKSAVDVQPLWTTSIRTLKNCMHDCYEDCPFYEQLQYAMDTRSSILFTYYASGDDRLARQAIIQLRNSFQARVNLTASRAPS